MTPTEELASLRAQPTDFPCEVTIHETPRAKRRNPKRHALNAFPPEAIETFWANVEKTETCWIWKGMKHSAGYGSFCHKGANYFAHRVSYSQFKPIPDGLTLNHLCRNRICVNPAHLEPVTLGENTRRHLVLITHCPNGHEYTPENTRRDSQNRRNCRACARIRWKSTHPTMKETAELKQKLADTKTQLSRLHAENKTRGELLKEAADALESLFVTQNGLGMSSQVLTKLRAHLAQSEPGAGKE